MEGFLKTIGFGSYTSKKQLDSIIGEVLTTPNYISEKDYINGEKHIEMFKKYGDSIGVKIGGYYDNKKFFHLEEIYPFVINKSISIRDELYFKKNFDKTSYTCICDDIRLGVTLTFSLQNTIDYRKSHGFGQSELKQYAIVLSGLSKEGKILLPVKKNIDNTMNIKTNQEDMFDIYTIVDNSFYPCKENNNCYVVVGDIEDVSYEKNSLTNEECCIMNIDCKGVSMKIVINTEDLIGMPMIGARFKGIIWLQGYVEIKK